MFRDLLMDTRSIRRYDEGREISECDLFSIAESLRFCPSAANLQRIRLALVCGRVEREAVFDTLSFAAFLRPWVRPDVGQRPVAYIVLMTKKEPDTNLAIDIGIAAEAMMLAARERGIGACMFRSFDSEKLTRVLGKDGYLPSLVLSLGYPAETVILEDVTDSFKYYRAPDDTHHVPKLKMDDLII